MGFQMVSCEDQYRKFPHLNRSEVLKLLKWQRTQPHLPTVTELEAIFFLHSCRCDLEAAKTCMDLYYTVRTMCPEYFADRNVHGDDIARRMNVLQITLLPGLTKEGYRIFILNFIDTDASNFDYVESLKYFIMILDFWLAKEGVCEGFIMVFDMTGVTISHLMKAKYFALKKSLYYIQECIPIRLVSVQFIHATSFMDKVLALLKPFLKKELYNGIIIHKSLDTFLDVHVSKSMMPDAYGGTAGNLTDMFKKTVDPMLAGQQYFDETETTKRVNEKLRPGKPKTERDLFGLFSAIFSGSKNK